MLFRLTSINSFQTVSFQFWKRFRCGLFVYYFQKECRMLFKHILAFPTNAYFQSCYHLNWQILIMVTLPTFWHLTGMICKACSWLTFDCFSAIFPNLLCSKGEKTTPWRPLLASRPSMKCTSAWQNLAVHYLLDGRVVPLYSAAYRIANSLFIWFARIAIS